MANLAGTVAAFALASHPIPTAAVTTMMAGLLAGAGNSRPTIVVGTLAVLAGQLSIGWSNDAYDAARDRATGRGDKPVAAARISVRRVLTAAVVALAGCVVLSLLLGWRAGLVHLVGVGCGWLYNVRGKFAVWSPAPFAIAFGGLPAVATLARPDPVWPPWWAMLAAGLVGVAAHFANVIPDLSDDQATGVRGAPQRVGATAAAVVGFAGALGAVALVALAPEGPPSATRWIGLAIAGAVAVAALTAWRRGSPPDVVFGAIVGVAAIGVVLLASGPAFP